MHIRKFLPKTILAKKIKQVSSLKKGFDFVSDHVIITDANGIILYANKAVEQNTGYSLNEILGKNPGDLWGGTMPPDFYQRMWHTIKEEKKPFVGEVQNRRKDGIEYWQELHISPILAKDSTIKFFIGIEPNITEQKQKEQFRKSFIAQIGQQIQHPLDATNWILQWLLSNSNLTEEEKQSLHEIYKHNTKIVDLFDNIIQLPNEDNYTKK